MLRSRKRTRVCYVETALGTKEQCTTVRKCGRRPGPAREANIVGECERRERGQGHHSNFFLHTCVGFSGRKGPLVWATGVATNCQGHLRLQGWAYGTWPTTTDGPMNKYHLPVTPEVATTECPAIEHCMLLPPPWEGIHPIVSAKGPGHHPHLPGGHCH